MSANVKEYGLVYGTWKTDFGAWAIQTRNVTMYLLVGERAALLIDTGYGEGDLPEVIAGITNLPLTVVNTHGHFDHTSGNGFWPMVWMGKGGEEAAGEVKPPEGLPYPDYEIRHLEDGQVFDLGGRKVEAIAIGAHHCSSFAFLDCDYRTLYTGDELEAGQVLMNVHGEEVANSVVIRRHLANMQKLKSRIEEFDRLAPAHNGGPLELSYIDDFMELDNQVLAGIAKIASTVAGYGWPNTIMGGDAELVRAEYGKASLVMKKEQ